MSLWVIAGDAVFLWFRDYFGWKLSFAILLDSKQIVCGCVFCIRVFDER